MEHIVYFVHVWLPVINVPVDKFLEFDRHMTNQLAELVKAHT